MESLRVVVRFFFLPYECVAAENCSEFGGHRDNKHWKINDLCFNEKRWHAMRENTRVEELRK